MSARERIRQVVEHWFLVEPLLFAVWTTHNLVVEPRIRTIRVRQGRIEYQPEFITSLEQRHLETVLRCEALRILLKHPYERRKKHAPLAYLASNVTLQEYLHTDLPFPYARDLFGASEFDQQYFEFYYARLQELVDQGAMAASAVSIMADQQGQAATGAEPAEAELSPLEAYANARVSGQENTQDWDAHDFLTDRINTQIRTAQETNRWGTVAGRLRERVLATLTPRLDYRAVLRQFRTSILSVHRVRTRMKPSRRYGFLYMGSRHDFTTRLLFAVDVSGSISSSDLVRGFSIINRFFKYGINTIDVLQFDTEIKGEPLSLKRARREVAVLGRGGTSFAPVMHYLDAHRDYDGLIIFTDGCAPVPPQPQNRTTRILWLFNNETTHREMHQALRPLGQSVYLKADRQG
jgi:predicted metal-dependent peptidase